MTHRTTPKYSGLRQLLRGVAALLVLAFHMTIPVDAQAQPAGGTPQPKVNFREPPRQYKQFQQGGWTIHVEQELIDGDQATAQRAMQRLTQRLADVLQILPRDSHADLRKLPIFLLYGSKARGGGLDSGANYHQKNAPDFHPNLDSRWRSCLVIHSAANYVELSDFWSVKVLVHELSHAHQLEHWPEKQSDILAAWEHAMQQNLYHNVPNDKGAVLPAAYAATNQLEYFAEISCMYFVGCNYQPFTRAELKTYDPQGYALVEKMWNLPTANSPTTSSNKPVAKTPAGAKPPQAAASQPTKEPPAAKERELRAWTNAVGIALGTAEFVGATGGEVRLRKVDGSTIKITLGNLSETDQRWIRTRRR
ncbi:MAG: hypothetical protein JSS27_13860 [Planctomycetes bacterium]|nr:hypothetical protein [Planctomycetota bacterium]